MENYFRNLSANIWTHLDNPIKSYDFSKFDYYLVCRWHSATICDVTTEQLSNRTVRKLHILLFMKIYLLHLGLLGLTWLCMHFMNLSSGLFISTKKRRRKMWKNYVHSQWIYSGRVPSREGDIENFAKLVLLNGLFRFAQHFYCWVSYKSTSTHPIHIIVWGNSTINVQLCVEINHWLVYRWRYTIAKRFPINSVEQKHISLIIIHKHQKQFNSSP